MSNLSVSPVCVKVSNGNHKIGKNTLIINMTSATDCPSKKLGLCQLGSDCAKCYALKAERQYPAVLPYRRAQERIWDLLSAWQIADQIVQIAQRKRKHHIKHLRFSEAGDFRSQADVDKMSDVAENLKPFGIRVYGYTARRDLDFSKVSDNLTVNGSAFMVHNKFTAVKGIDSAKPVCAGNCRSCNLCKVPRGIEIQVEYH